MALPGRNENGAIEPLLLLWRSCNRLTGDGGYSGSWTRVSIPAGIHVFLLRITSVTRRAHRRWWCLSVYVALGVAGHWQSGSVVGIVRAGNRRNMFTGTRISWRSVTCRVFGCVPRLLIGGRDRWALSIGRGQRHILLVGHPVVRRWISSVGWTICTTIRMVVPFSRGNSPSRRCNWWVQLHPFSEVPFSRQSIGGHSIPAWDSVRTFHRRRFTSIHWPTSTGCVVSSGTGVIWVTRQKPYCDCSRSLDAVMKYL
jgi:hypothetical protein